MQFTFNSWGGWLLFNRQISIQGSGTWTVIKILKLLGPWSQWEILKRTPSSGDEAPETNFPHIQWPGNTMQCYQIPGKHFIFTISSRFEPFNLVIRNTNTTFGYFSEWSTATDIWGSLAVLKENTSFRWRCPLSLLFLFLK